MVRSALLGVLCLACGGTVVPPDAAPDAGDAGWADVADVTLAADAAVYPDAAYKPTCADVGAFPGASTCCKGDYCGGYCSQVKDAGTTCVCAGRIGGCPWPFVCCQDTCVGVQLCK